MSCVDVQFDSEGQRCAAWLYLPEGARPAPVVVMGHGLGAIRTMRLPAYAERFCQAGYACLVFDYRHLGDSEGEPRQLLDIHKQLADWRSAVAFVRQRPEVDGARVVLWGTSFGGGHVINIGAEDRQVAAVIAQCPFTDGLASALAMSPLSSLQVTGMAVLDQLGAWFGARPVRVAIAGAPHSAALMTAPDAMAGYLNLVDPSSHFSNELAARIALYIAAYRPGLKTPKLACPTLFCVCESDSVAPSRATLRHAKKAPKGRIEVYQAGHFDIYVGAAFERAVADQLAFLSQCVPVSSTAAASS